MMLHNAGILLLAQPDFTQLVHFELWVPIFFITLAAVCGITTLVYMLGIALGMQNLKMWAKSEFANIAAMVILFGALVASLNVAWVISKDVAQTVYSLSGGEGSQPDHFGLAKAYLEQSIKCERTVYKWVFWINGWYEMWEKANMDVAGPEGYTGSIYGVATGFYHYIAGNLTYLMIFQYVQLRFLDFIQIVMMPLFLPIGIVLRTFAPTRGAGGLMMAIAIGFYFVFPMSYVFIYAASPSDNSACTHIENAQNPLSLENACFTNISDLYAQKAVFKAHENFFAGIVKDIEVWLASFLFHALFYPLVALIVTFTFIRQVGALLGADLAEIGRGFIKLI